MQRRYRLRKIPTAARAGDAFWTELSAREAPESAERSRLLREGEIVAYELVPWGSNYTFLAALGEKDGEPRDIAIYKPRQGEAPLWDFPDGTLYRREYASYLLTRWLGWDLIPETIIREGPYGIGTLQLYVESEEDTHYFSLRDTHRVDMQRMAIFDIITNNADRKAGHMLKGLDGKIYGIDHGLTFNTQPKLRTVIWDFVGEPIPDNLLEDLMLRLYDNDSVADLRDQLKPLLDRGEIDRFFKRVERLLEIGVFPGASASNSHHVPWGFI